MKADAKPPSDAQLLLWEIARLQDGAEERLLLHRELLMLESEFPTEGMFFPGGDESYRAYIEARLNYIDGNSIGTILLAQACLENFLAACIAIEHTALGISSRNPGHSRKLPNRPALNWLLNECEELRLITDDESKKIRELCELRNPLSHYRSMSDKTKLWRRSAVNNVSNAKQLEDDAYFALGIAAELLPRISKSIGRGEP